MARALRTIRKLANAVEVYLPNDNLSGKPYCKARGDIAAEWVEQDLARWFRNGEAVHLTETGAELPGTTSAITYSECAANAGAAKRDSSILTGRCKVKAWRLVGADPAYGEPTRAPLPAEPGGIITMSREKLERLSSGIGLELDGSVVRPVDTVLRENRTRSLDNDFVQQNYTDDDGESPGEKQERLYGVPDGCRNGDVGELGT